MLNIKKQVLAAFGLVFCWFMTGAYVSAYSVSGNEPQTTGNVKEQVLKNSTEPSGGLPVYLYFADNQNQYLLGEEIFGLSEGDSILFCRQVIEALINGPDSNLVSTIPLETELRAIYIDGKTVYADFSREISTSHPGGISSELMTVYSIVNTLVLNVDEVDQVKILIGGNDAETLSGHIDISAPLSADMLLIR